jgi:hypothetical protein
VDNVSPDGKVDGFESAEDRALYITEYSAYLSQANRADERTRTADLLITSDSQALQGLARVCKNLHI